MSKSTGSRPHRDAGSFRDPSGHVFILDQAVIRSINPSAATHFQKVLDAGIIESLAARGLMIATDIDPEVGDLDAFKGPRGELPSRVVKHPFIPFISYPYEWTFSQLKDAAIAHLEIQIQSLERDVVLSDATPFNMQFVSGKPMHIDVLSMRPYQSGEPWLAYNQFCRMFLLPLLLEAWAGIPFQSWLRGNIDGVEFSHAVAVLPKRKLWLSLNGIMHVLLQAKSLRTDSASAAGKEIQKPHVSKQQYRAILLELQRWIAGLTSARTAPTYWNSYAAVNSYLQEMRALKERFVEDWAKGLPGGVLWDIGGNTGDYACVALLAGMSSAIVFDSDLDSLEKAYARSKAEKLMLLPLLMNLADPSPSMGWNQSERKGLNERSKPDGLMALAVIHHLVIGRNIPLASVVAWFVNAAPSGIIEFVPKTDPMVVQMLANREDVFLDYDESQFKAYLAQHANITNELRFERNNRVLFSYQRKT